MTGLDETLAELRAKGVEVCDDMRAVLPSGIECCVVRDPDGFPIEVVQMPTLALLPYEAIPCTLDQIIAEGAAAGLALGLLGAAALGRVLTSLLYGVKPTDVFTFVGVAGVLLAVVLAACLVPARRAVRVDPLEALRSE